MFNRCFILLSILLLLAAKPKVAGAEDISVSAAISLKDALTEIAKNYQAQTGDHVAFNFGASGQLAAQIKQGAPVDAFISAGVREMDLLDHDGLIEPASRRTICSNRLVLIVPADAANPPHSFSDLTDARFQKIAMGQPRTVPAGEYAQQVLDRLKITDAVANRLVFGENVRQVLDYVIKGEVDAGIVYSTDAAQAGAKVCVAATADESLHDPIQYPAAALKDAKSAAAWRFIDYLATDAAQKVLDAHAFLVNHPTTKPTTAPSR